VAAILPVSYTHPHILRENSGIQTLKSSGSLEWRNSTHLWKREEVMEQVMRVF
jgi:hypothetical protein